MDKNKKFQLELVQETAQRLVQQGNTSAASCLYSIAAAMACNYEQLLAGNICAHMKEILKNQDL